MNLDPYNFAYIGSVQRVKLNSHVLEEFKEQSQSQDEGKDKGTGLPLFPRLICIKGYVSPNPANLSPAIAHVVGKGININIYV